MYKYDIEVYKTENIPSESDFWKLLREYSRTGLSDPLIDDEVLGKAHLIRIESGYPVTLQRLQAEFPNLDIVELSELAQPAS